MSDLKKFREDTKKWLDENCPPSMRSGAEGLNFRVRNGIGCGPFAIITRQSFILFLLDYVNTKKSV